MDTKTLLDTLEHETGPSPEWSVLWLHGLGADGNDFMPIVPELVRPGEVISLFFRTTGKRSCFLLPVRIRSSGPRRQKKGSGPWI